MAAKENLAKDYWINFGHDPIVKVKEVEIVLIHSIQCDFQVELPYKYLLKYVEVLKGEFQTIFDLTICLKCTNHFIIIFYRTLSI